ncbi:MAG: 7-cyano-7-deazaguanine reductase [bacterium]|nr:7-cyano-7-deazaguanine reductase [bacterium]
MKENEATEITSAEKIWSDRSILKAIPNSSGKPLELKIKNPEITFEGVKAQPDFGTAYLTFYPKDLLIELKSLKEYFVDFRSRVLSYERFTSVVYDDIMAVYKPERFRIAIYLRPRGGIFAKCTLDSDWPVLGGEDKYKDANENDGADWPNL